MIGFRPRLTAALVVAAAGCGPEPALPRRCTTLDGPLPVSEVLADLESPCASWVRRTYGRAVRVFPENSPWRGSGVLWTKDTEATTAAFVTAGYVLSPCWTKWDMQLDGDAVCAEEAYDPTVAPVEVALRLATEPLGTVRSEWSPAFAVMHPSLDPQELVEEVSPSSVLYSVWAVDDQALPGFTGQPRPIAGPLREASPDFPDPEGLSMDTPTWAEARAGSPVLIVGFPERSTPVPGTDARTMAVVVSEVLENEAAEDAIDQLAAAGDLEGMLPYEPAAEMLLAGDVPSGMGGAGVFDEDGRLVGIVVRHAQTDAGPKIVRAIRMSHVVAEIRRVLAVTSPDVATAAARFLPRDVQPP